MTEPRRDTVHPSDALPRVTVLMAVHNGMPFLPEAIESVLNQSWRDFEFIVVDDGSSDETPEILARYASADERVRVLRNQRNLGAARTRNIGLRRARGLYVAGQDADDVSLPERLALQVAYLDRHPEIGGVGTWPLFVDEQGRSLEAGSFPLLTGSRRLHDYLLDTNCFVPASMMIRRSVLEDAGGYDPTWESAEDYDLLLRTAEITKLENLPSRLYVYRTQARSISQSSRSQQMRYKALALERALSRRYGANPPEALLELAARDFLRAAYLAHAKGEDDSSAWCMVQSQRLAPRIFRRGPVVRSVIDRYMSDPMTAIGMESMERFFGQRLPHNGHLRRLHSQIVARLHIQALFENVVEGRPADGRMHLLAGVRADPRWLLNRGVLALALRELVGRPMKPEA